MTLPYFLLLMATAAAPPATATHPPVATPTAAASVSAATAASAAASEADTAPAEAPPEAEGEPEASEEVEKASEELEAIRALEEKTVLGPVSNPETEIRRAMSRLGVTSPLRARLEEKDFEFSLREDALNELGVITDLASFDISRVRDAYDIPVELQPVVAQYIEFFRGAGRKWFRKWMSRATRYVPMMQSLLEKEGMPKDTVYLAMIESGFSAQAYSRARAAGPWQFIPSTGKRFGLKQDFWVDERRDPIKATVSASRYLLELHRQFGHWYLAWAGYNAGGGRIQRAINRVGSRDFWKLAETRWLAKETKHYVPKLIAAALVAKHPESFGFQLAEFETMSPLAYEEVQLVDPVDLEVVAKAAEVPLSEVRELNPELKRWCTPPASKTKPYVLRLPQGAAPKFAENFPKIAPKERLTFVVHRIQKGDTLSQIAKRYGTAPEPILQLNRLTSARRLRIHSDLVVPIPRRGSELGEGAPVLARHISRARREGYVAPKPEDEVPAGTPRTPASPGEVKTETVDGKTRVTYTVQEGDSLWGIGQRFGVSVADLRQWNDLGPRAKLQLGKPVVLWPTKPVTASVPPLAPSTPGPATPKAPAPTASGSSSTPMNSGAPLASAERPAKHLLTPGDTLWSVAQRYNVPLEDLKRWNRIAHPRALQAGQELRLVAP
ncbi:MAG: LysM peptidoglycan-binding domain-containing protein [Myxococcaceae bacterium]